MTVKVTRTSFRSGKTLTLELDISPEDYATWLKGEVLTQHLFPNLSAEHREFLISGLHPGEFDEIVGEPD